MALPDMPEPGSSDSEEESILPLAPPATATKTDATVTTTAHVTYSTSATFAAAGTASSSYVDDDGPSSLVLPAPVRGVKRSANAPARRALAVPSRLQTTIAPTASNAAADVIGANPNPNMPTDAIIERNKRVRRGEVANDGVSVTHRPRTRTFLPHALAKKGGAAPPSHSFFTLPEREVPTTARDRDATALDAAATSVATAATVSTLSAPSGSAMTKTTATTNSAATVAAATAVAAAKEQAQYQQYIETQQHNTYSGGAGMQGDDAALRAIVSAQERRGRGRRGREDGSDITFVDVNDRDRRLTFEEWQQHYGSAEVQPAPKYRPSTAPDQGARGKHQISYLVHQAKARQSELQVHWAQGTEARKASRTRYGF